MVCWLQCAIRLRWAAASRGRATAGSASCVSARMDRSRSSARSARRSAPIIWLEVLRLRTASKAPSTSPVVRVRRSLSFLWGRYSMKFRTKTFQTASSSKSARSISSAEGLTRGRSSWLGSVTACPTAGTVSSPPGSGFQRLVQLALSNWFPPSKGLDLLVPGQIWE